MVGFANPQRKTQSSAIAKFRMAVSEIAARFDTSSGNPQHCLKVQVSTVLATIDSKPLAK